MSDDNCFVRTFLKKTITGNKQLTFHQETCLDNDIDVVKRKGLKLDSDKQIHIKGSKKKNKKTNFKPKTRNLTVTNTSYSSYQGLRNLWNEYMKELLESEKSKPQHDIQFIQDMLLKADFHGAVFEVVESKCPSHKGIKGTVVMETQNTFVIITSSDRCLKIPKTNNIFQVVCSNYRVLIFGDQFNIKPAHRITKRFKNYIPAMKLL